jgi:hypothetical protein
LGPQTPSRCGKRTVTLMDVDSLEKAMQRTAARNLDDVGTFQRDILGEILVSSTERGGPPGNEDYR